MKKLCTILVVLIFILAGCGSSSHSANDASHAGHEEHYKGDIRETTESIYELPSFLENTHETIASIYSEVPHYQELLEHIPCYCGCGEYVHHENTYQCFIHDQFENGAVQWDNHGMRCNVCLEIAHDSMRLSDKGHSDLEIRNYIDSVYTEEAYAKPTDTPMPKE